MLELNNLELAGKGAIFDKSTGSKGEMYASAPLDFCQVVLSLDQEVTPEGMIIPRLHITDVGFQLPQEDWEVFIESKEIPVGKVGPLKKQFQ